MEGSGVDLTVSIPIYNERENIPLLLAELRPVLDGLGRSYEILFVDDGSDDGSFEVIREFALQDKRIRAIRFRRNVGQTAALDAGFKESSGEVIVTMDGDVQNDPADIPKLLHAMDEGDYDIVSGWRRDRKDRFLTRRLPSSIANRLISKITSVRLHDYGCTLKAYRREVAKHFNLYGEMHRFIPALGRFVGATITEVPVNHRPRRHGKSKYGLSRIMRVILDLITVKFFQGYMTQPIKVIGRLGIFFFLIAFGSLAYVIFDRFAFGQDMTNSPFFYLSILGFFSGLQLVTMGLLAEILIRTYFESQNKPTYIIKERLN